jgi:hypothetical protein
MPNQKIETQKIEEGILAETVAGENLRAFISVVDDKCFFGFRKIKTEDLMEVEELKFEEAMERMMEFVKSWRSDKDDLTDRETGITPESTKKRMG